MKTQIPLMPSPKARPDRMGGEPWTAEVRFESYSGIWIAGTYRYDDDYHKEHWEGYRWRWTAVMKARSMTRGKNREYRRKQKAIKNTQTEWVRV
jgi:hypothetical protein